MIKEVALVLCNVTTSAPFSSCKVWDSNVLSGVPIDQPQMSTKLKLQYQGVPCEEKLFNFSRSRTFGYFILLQNNLRLFLRNKISRTFSHARIFQGRGGRFRTAFLTRPKMRK